MKKKKKAMLSRIKTIMKSRGISRDQLLDHLNAAPGRRLSRSSLDHWFKESRRDHHPSMDDIIAALSFLDDFTPLNEMLEPMGWAVVTGRQAAFADIGEKVVEIIAMASSEWDLSPCHPEAKPKDLSQPVGGGPSLAFRMTG